MEAVKAMVVGGWKPTHLGSFTASRWGWGCPETQAPLTLPLLHLRGGEGQESPHPKLLLCLALPRLRSRSSPSS